MTLSTAKYDYTLTFSPGQLPLVVEEYGGFWSITAYLASGALIHNPIDRYLINGVNTPGLVYDTGALTLYIQKTRPDTGIQQVQIVLEQLQNKVDLKFSVSSLDYYRIAGNFRGVLFSHFSWSSNQPRIINPRISKGCGFNWQVPAS